MKEFPQARTEHIGQFVFTVGPVDLDLEVGAPSINEGDQRELPTGYPMILRHIDEDDMAYGYHATNGLMRMPAVLLVPLAATGLG